MRTLLGAQVLCQLFLIKHKDMINSQEGMTKSLICNDITARVFCKGRWAKNVNWAEKKPTSHKWHLLRYYRLFRAQSEWYAQRECPKQSRLFLSCLWADNTSHPDLGTRLCLIWQMEMHLARGFKYTSLRQTREIKSGTGTSWMSETRNLPVSIVCFFQKLDEVTRLQGEVSCFLRLVGQLHSEMTGVSLQTEKTESNCALGRSPVPFLHVWRFHWH